MPPFTGAAPIVEPAPPAGPVRQFDIGFFELIAMREYTLAAGEGIAWVEQADVETVTYVLDGSILLDGHSGDPVPVHAGEVLFGSADQETMQMFGLGGDTTRLIQAVIAAKTPRDPSAQDRSAQEHFALDHFALGAPRGSQIDRIDRPSGQTALWRVVIMPRDSVAIALDRAHAAWFQVIRGPCDIGCVTLSSGQGIGYSDTGGIILRAHDAITELLVLDLP